MTNTPESPLLSDFIDSTKVNHTHTNTDEPAPSADSNDSSTKDSPIKFTDFELPNSLLTALDALAFESPTPVQEQTLNSALAGNDLMVSAQTGSGKTVAFLLPCLAQVINNLPPAHSRHKKARPQVLVICPTRELVQQVFQDAINLLKYTKGVRVASVMGGMSYNKQISGLKGAQIVIATPGRLLDLESRNNIQLDHVTHMVLDEADRMLDLGFSEDLASIAKHCEKREQTLLFSATFAKNIVHLAEKLMDNPTRIELANSQDKHADITQALYWADDENHKQALLMHWLEHEPIDQAVIFAPTQVETERLAFALRKADYSVVDLHGGMKQYMRMKQIKKLRDGKAKILVATDVAARGLDVPSISHVINYGIPMKNEDYVHRIGRTGRAGRQGHAITVATHSDRKKVFALQHFLKQDIDVLEVEGLEPTPYQPRQNRDNKKRSRRRGKPRPNQSERYNNKKFDRSNEPGGSRDGRDRHRDGNSFGGNGNKAGGGYRKRADSGNRNRDKDFDKGYDKGFDKNVDKGNRRRTNKGGYNSDGDNFGNSDGFSRKKKSYGNKSDHYKAGRPKNTHVSEQVFGKKKPKKSDGDTAFKAKKPKRKDRDGLYRSKNKT